MSNVVIVNAKRSAIGKFLGSLSGLSSVDIGSSVLNSLIESSKIQKSEVDEVIMGQVLTGGHGQNPARQTMMLSEIPYEKSAVTINQVCGSGLRAIAIGAQSILLGQSEIVIAGGQESMSNSHHTANIRNGIKMGDGSLKDSMIVDGLWCAMNDYHMGTTAENIAEKYKISKEEQDLFSVASQNKAENAQKEGYFKNEICPVKIKVKKDEISFDVDEFPRHGSTLEKISSLKPVFKKDGTVTAGNASGLNDGAAAVLIMKESKAKDLGLEVMANIVSWSSVGVDPSIMGIGPVPAVQKALKEANWKIEELRFEPGVNLGEPNRT